MNTLMLSLVAVCCLAVAITEAQSYGRRGVGGGFIDGGGLIAGGGGGGFIAGGGGGGFIAGGGVVGRGGYGGGGGRCTCRYRGCFGGEMYRGRCGRRRSLCCRRRFGRGRW